MFAVGEILVSDEVLNAPFSCNLGACHGGCCVQGDSGAPLEPAERDELEDVLPIVRKNLRPEALEVIDNTGTWEELEPKKYATTCVNDRECVFVTYDGPIAKCAIEKAYFAGETTFRKPISCHLFPLRAETFGHVEALNYEQIPLCDPAIKSGRQKNITLLNFLREPLVRKYGETWYEQFQQACEDRRKVLNMKQS